MYEILFQVNDYKHGDGTNLCGYIRQIVGTVCT